jgi:hypothetical protein
MKPRMARTDTDLFAAKRRRGSLSGSVGEELGGDLAESVCSVFTKAEVGIAEAGDEGLHGAGRVRAEGGERGKGGGVLIQEGEFEHGNGGEGVVAPEVECPRGGCADC